jgi:uncharacterized membrane protein YjjP (DUF1212 family)
VNPIFLTLGFLLLLGCDILFVVVYQGGTANGSSWALIDFVASFCIALAACYLIRRQKYPLAIPVLLVSLVLALWALWLASTQALSSSVEEAVPDLVAVIVFCISAPVVALLGISALAAVTNAHRMTKAT